MIHAVLGPSGRPAAGSPAAIGTIARLFADRTGQLIAPSRMWRLETALKPLLRDRKMATLDDLVTGLVAARDGELSDHVVDALLNQESSFFRDAAVIDLTGDAAVALYAGSRRRLRIWSAGCSTGQEPLSLAILLEERGLGEDKAEIVATDVSHGAIARAKAARFSQFEIQRGLSIHRMMAWFEGGGPEWSARRELVRRIQFRQHNLIAGPPPPGGFDIILCRNVLLYLPPDLRGEAFDRFATALRPGGLLVLGASETVIGQTKRFAPSRDWRGFYSLAPRRD